MKPPKQIYLQWYGNETDPGERRDIDSDHNATGANMEVSWREDKINEHDVRYVRADIVAKDAIRLAKIRKLLEVSRILPNLRVSNHLSDEQFYELHKLARGTGTR